MSSVSCSQLTACGETVPPIAVLVLPFDRASLQISFVSLGLSMLERRLLRNVRGSAWMGERSRL